MARQIGKITEALESRTIQVRVEGVTCSCGYPVSMDAGYLREFLVATGWKERDGKWTCNHCEHVETQRQLAEANGRIKLALSICRDQNRLSGFHGKRDEAWAVATKVAGALMGEK